MTVKKASVFPRKQGQRRRMINGGVNLDSDVDGTLEAVFDFQLVTKWKTAEDSLLAARKHARPDSEKILIIGSGTEARSLRQAYGTLFPNARFTIWSRTYDNAAAFADEIGATATRALEQAVGDADIVTSATMTTDPHVRGDWLAPGTHVDLIGSYRPDMREADDVALQRARVFVDSYDTTVGHIGEIKIPLESGAIPRSHLVAEYYQMERFGRVSPDEITLFKNGGGAHLDLMTSRYILDRWRTR